VKNLFRRAWRETDGVLSFEWTLLTSLLTVGAVSGIAAVRDAVTDELGDIAQAMVSLDQSYVIQPPLQIHVHTAHGSASFRGGFAGRLASGSTAADSAFIDASSYADGMRGPVKVVEFPRRDEQPDVPPPAADELAPAL
jgi:Flp pilus assembly pilin Flp